MYTTISPQKTGGNYAQSAKDFVAYLEKENQEQGRGEHFFNQYDDKIAAEEVIKGIDDNTAKLKKSEPKFYSITINPSKRELSRLKNNSKDLKRYTRKLMEDYVKAFNREINDRSVTIDDIKYYAKIEHHRTFKGTDREIKENQPYATKILRAKQQIRAIEQGKEEGNISRLQKEVDRLEQEAPHQQNGQRVVQGMQKEGNQSHIHIIVSRKDASNRYSLSPGSKYKASTVTFKGKTVQRGFNRDQFFKGAERTFDKTFGYKRNYVETYKARKQLSQNPKLYFAALLNLPASEKEAAFKLLNRSGIPMPKIPTNQAQLALRAFKQMRKGLAKAVKSSSIGI